MNLAADYLRALKRETLEGWNRFWFSAADPATLGLIRILAGAMLLYTHLVWTLELEAFFGPKSWISADAAALALGDEQGHSYAWSYLWHIQSTGLLWAAHLAALAVFACLTLGLFSRAAAVLAYLIAVSYVNRTPGALFGLDQINCLLAMYLMVGDCGGAWSLDRWLAARRSGGPLPTTPSVSANIAIRLIQVHMCVIYFFAGLSKLQGETWWAGTAMWGAVANLEYQSLDMTWLASWPLLVALMTQVTVYWELSFCALIWPRMTRPLVLLLAVPLHLGIAFCMGMITFGLVMLMGCLSFVPPWLVRKALFSSPLEGGAGQGSEPAESTKGQVVSDGGRTGRNARRSAAKRQSAR